MSYRTSGSVCDLRGENEECQVHRCPRTDCIMQSLQTCRGFYSTLCCFCTHSHMYPHGVEAVLISRRTDSDSLIKKMPGGFVYTVCCGMVCRDCGGTASGHQPAVVCQRHNIAALAAGKKKHLLGFGWNVYSNCRCKSLGLLTSCADDFIWSLCCSCSKSEVEVMSQILSTNKPVHLFCHNYPFTWQVNQSILV